MVDLIQANSIGFELVHIAAQTCECGGTYEIKSQQLLELNGEPIDRIRTVCQQCGSERMFFFAVHSFYNQPEKYGRFEATEAAFREALAAIHAQQWDEAETLLRRVLDPVEGEPAFGWAHYHLGMVLLVLERYEEGLAHIQLAVRLNPRETEFYRGLSKAYMLLGREDEALEAQRQQAELTLSRAQAQQELLNRQEASHES